MKKRMLYLEDLWNFFVSQNKDVKFSSKDSDTTIVVHIDEPFTFNADQDNELNLYAPIRLCHTLKNVNQSSIPENAMKDAMHTAYEIPILGYIYPDPDNEEQFTFAGHEMYIDENNEVVYEESPVGVVTSEYKLKLVYDEDADKTYLDGVGKIWRTYTKAAEILEREKKFWVSVELVVDDLSFSAKDKVLVINAFRFSGVTILGKSREDGSLIRPGMTGANISIADFSEQNNSIFSQNEKVIKLLSELNEKIDGLNIETSYKEGGNKPLFEELLKKYSKTVEEIDFEYEGLSDEELEALFAEHFEDTPKKKKKGEDDDVTPSGEGDDSGDDDQDDDDQDDDESDDQQDEPDQNDQPDQNVNQETGYDANNANNDASDGEQEEVNYYSAELTVDINGEKKTFATLVEKLNALCELVNATYGEVDNDFYAVDADEEKRIVEMHQWIGGKHFRQSYSVKKDVYSLVGDRVETYEKYLTQDEINQLENMKANYSSIESELASFKAEPEKQAVLAEECYAQIADTEAYKKLAEQDTHFTMSVDEVRAELDKQLLEYAKGHEIKFATKDTEKKAVGVKLFGNPAKKAGSKSGRYGGLFSKDS